MRFAHLAIRVQDMDKMLDFYCRGMGFEEAFRIKNEDGSLRIAYVHISDGQYLELCSGGEYRAEFDDKKTVGIRHICFIVDNIREIKQKMENSRVIFNSEIMVMKDKNLAAYLFDPEGNKIELVQTMPQSPQYLFEKNKKG